MTFWQLPEYLTVLFLGRKQSKGGRGSDLLKSACVLYGQAIEAILELESYFTQDTEQSDITSIYNAFAILRPTLFLNLAQSNLCLDSPDGALKCCNSAIQLCNTPGLFYGDLEPADEIPFTSFPVAESMIVIITKALFRRGKCFEQLGNIRCAMADYEEAEQISPGNVEVKESLQGCLRLLQGAANNLIPSVPNDSDNVTFHLKKNKNDSTELGSEENVPRAIGMNSPPKAYPSVTDEMTETAKLARIIEMTVNGGKCWLRRAYWSQTVLDVTVYIPISALTSHMFHDKNMDSGSVHSYNSSNDKNNCTGNDDNDRISSSSSSSSSSSDCNIDTKNCKKYNDIINKYKIAFSSRCITIENSIDDKTTAILLEHVIISTECTWTLDPDSSILVFYLIKAPSFEWFPGQEVSVLS